jgi:peptidoglycan/xylan/chitin deacetylase (PgdA/CDA1 family)
MKKIVLLLLVLFLVVALGWNLSKSTNFQLFGELVDRVHTDEKVFALTFDDGPTEFSHAVLSQLAEHDVKATFYLVGQAIVQSPELAELIVSQNHELGNHSYTHTRMVLKTLDFVRQEVLATNTLIRQSGFNSEITFRPPYGKKLFSLTYFLNREQITTITWYVAPDSELPFEADAEEITQFLLEKVQPGSIILLHVMFESRKNSMLAVPDIIQGLKEKGYRFVTVSELLSLRSDE